MKSYVAHLDLNQDSSDFRDQDANHLRHGAILLGQWDLNPYKQTQILLCYQITPCPNIVRGVRFELTREFSQWGSKPHVLSQLDQPPIYRNRAFGFFSARNALACHDFIDVVSYFMLHRPATKTTAQKTRQSNILSKPISSNSYAALRNSVRITLLLLYVSNFSHFSSYFMYPWWDSNPHPLSKTRSERAVSAIAPQGLKTRANGLRLTQLLLSIFTFIG